MKSQSLYLIPLLALLLFSRAGAQQEACGSTKAYKKLKRNVLVLSSDKMEGRETGTAGEEKAAVYIAQQFKKAGLLPKGTENSWYQPFDFNAAAGLGEKNFLRLNNKEFKMKGHYFPLPQSGNGAVKGEVVKVGYGISATDLGHDDYKGLSGIEGKIFAIEMSSPDGVHPHSKFREHYDIDKKIELAVEKGAAAVIFINSDIHFQEPEMQLNKKGTAASVPVIYARGLAYKLIMDASKAVAELSVEIIKNQKTGKNVIGYLNNGADRIAVIGAHYDHLGYGDEGSLHRGEPAIHNGADDNASGIALMLLLAEKLKKAGHKEHNYLFIAFSGEEKGLLGSNYFVKNPTVDIDKVNYMLNFDMVGRLEEKKLAVNGVGTSDAWSELLKIADTTALKIVSTESGIGPSDHTSFYLQDIPVLHLFTGTHEDYHKPSDDPESLNYEGIMQIACFTEELIARLDSMEKLTFLKTKDADSRKAPKFSVTLGVVPDYMHQEEGMKIDGITEGKPAHQAGLQKGDIVLQMGEMKIKDMMSYMKALAQFKKGDKTRLVVKRNEELIELGVEF